MKTPDQMPSLFWISTDRRRRWWGGEARALYLAVLSFSAVFLGYGGMVMADTPGVGKPLDADLQKILRPFEKPANPFTPTLSENAITSIPVRPNFDLDEKKTEDPANGGKALGLYNISKLRFESGQIVVTPAKESNMVNSLVNFSGVVDADTFGKTKSGKTVLGTSRR